MPNGDRDLMLQLMDGGLSAGEAALILRRARENLDTLSEDVSLAAARVLLDEADMLAGLAAERQAAALRLRMLRRVGGAQRLRALRAEAEAA